MQSDENNSARRPESFFEEKTAALQAGDEPLDLHKATRERWPAMSDTERLPALEALEVPRDLWLELVQSSEPSPLQQRAAELFAKVKPAQVVRLKPATISINMHVHAPTYYSRAVDSTLSRALSQ